MPRAVRIALVVVAALIAVVPAYAQGAPDGRLVLALYYPWYNHGTWESGTTADIPLYPYESWELEAIQRHVGWAKEAGIDALVSAWFGPADDNPTESNFKTLLEVSQTKGLRAALMLETDSGFFFHDRGSQVRALRHFLDVHANHPAYLKVDSRPVIFIWNPLAVFATNGARVHQKSTAAVAAWQAMLDEVDPTRRAIWIAEGEHTPMLDVFDGIFPYSVAWSPNPAAQIQTYAQRTRDYNARTGSDKLRIATAMPGYDDTRVPGRRGTFAVDRAGGGYYQTTFKAAIATQPDWIVITSFNEFMEGSHIEPSQNHGRLYLDLTRELADLFRAS